MKYAVSLSEKYLGLQFEDLSSEAVQKAKECIVDILGCTYAGLSFQSSRIVQQYALDNYAPGKCTLIGSSR
ncbi:MmgE/PrpD family protein, partial [Thermodesulfobacteriota bacterium]